MTSLKASLILNVALTILAYISFLTARGNESPDNPETHAPENTFIISRSPALSPPKANNPILKRETDEGIEPATYVIEVPIDVATYCLAASGWNNVYDSNGELSSEAAVLFGLDPAERDWLQVVIDERRDFLRKFEVSAAYKHQDSNGEEWLVIPANPSLALGSLNFFHEVLGILNFPSERTALIENLVLGIDSFYEYGFGSERYLQLSELEDGKVRLFSRAFDSDGNLVGELTRTAEKSALIFRYGHLFEDLAPPQ